MNEIIMIVGYPASGKSSLTKEYEASGYKKVNRDIIGGSVEGLLPIVETLLNEQRPIVLDNTHVDVVTRKPFIDLAKKYNVPIHCKWLQTSIEDAQVNSLNRMWEKHGRLFMDRKEMKEIKRDSNTFPVVVLFAYKKNFQKPTLDEGFATIEKIPFIRKTNNSYVNKALFLDYDGTLRDSIGDYKFPTKPGDIRILKERSTVLKDYEKRGYKLLGVSNQSGIARNQVTEEDVCKCFDKTNEMLGVDIDYRYCPHNVPPSCYCRKPQSGMLIQLMHEYKLDLRQCIMVGDQTTDKTTAKRLGIKYYDESEFFTN